MENRFTKTIHLQRVTYHDVSYCSNRIKGAVHLKIKDPHFSPAPVMLFVRPHCFGARCQVLEISAIEKSAVPSI